MMAIYMIKNILNNKIYIGSAKNFERRCYEHKHTLKKGLHHSIHLQNAGIKYGENNFIFEAIEKIEDEKILVSKEEYEKKRDDYETIPIEESKKRKSLRIIFN
jgi:group I intron endonuclease